MDELAIRLYVPDVDCTGIIIVRSRTEIDSEDVYKVLDDTKKKLSTWHQELTDLDRPIRVYDTEPDINDYIKALTKAGYAAHQIGNICFMETNETGEPIEGWN